MRFSRLLISVVSLALLPVAGAIGDSSESAAWGQPNRGLCSHVEIKGRQFAPGKPIQLSYSVKNLAKEPTRVWESGFWLNHLIRVCDQNGKLVAMLPDGEQNAKWFTPGGARRGNWPVDIEPGKEYNPGIYGDDIARLFDLSAPGIYSVQVLYEEYQDGWEGQLWSNVIIFQIVAQ